MPVVLRYNETIDLNKVDYSGVITRAELDALAGFAGPNPVHMRRDTLNVVALGAWFDVSDAYLDALFARYRELYARLRFEMVRRAAWVCLSGRAAPTLHYWLSGDTRKAMLSAVRQFDNYADAGEWLVLNSDEIAAAERGEEFVELFSFTEAAALAR